MGCPPEGFPEFIPSTPRVSARRHLVDESPALTAVLQAQPGAIVTARCARSSRAGGGAALRASTDRGLGIGLLSGHASSAIAATGVVIKSEPHRTFLLPSLSTTLA